MSKVKVGDKIRIVNLDWATRDCWPQYIGTLQVVIDVDEDGDPRFAADTSTGGLWMQCSEGAEFDIVQ